MADVRAAACTSHTHTHKQIWAKLNFLPKWHTNTRASKPGSETAQKRTQKCTEEAKSAVLFWMLTCFVCYGEIFRDITKDSCLAGVQVIAREGAPPWDNSCHVLEVSTPRSRLLLPNTHQMHHKIWPLQTPAATFRLLIHIPFPWQDYDCEVSYQSSPTSFLPNLHPRWLLIKSRITDLFIYKSVYVHAHAVPVPYPGICWPRISVLHLLQQPRYLKREPLKREKCHFLNMPLEAGANRLLS